VLSVRLLGQPRFELDGAPWTFHAPAKALALLGYLVTHRAAPIRRDYLASIFWPDDSEEEARTKLRRHFHMLQNALPADGVPYTLNTRQTTGWNPRASAIVDVIAFEEACDREALDEAGEWYGGEFLAPLYDEWVLAERERLRNLQLENLRKAVLRKRSERDLSGALVDVARIFAIDRWREDTLRTEMRLRAELGDRGGALAAYRSFERRLRDELDVEPLPETRAAFERLLRDEDPIAGDEPVKAAPQRAPGPRTLPFGGRDAEIATLRRAWDAAAEGAGTTVLVGGEAGAGKSRLAAELALIAESEGGRVFIGTTSPQETGPYEALLESLREALPVVLATVRDASLLGVLATLLPEIAARTGVVAPPPLDPRAERLRFFDAAMSVLGALARSRPLVILLEDLHWAQPATLSLVEHCARRVSSQRILLLGTYREEEVGRTHELRALRGRLEKEGSLSALALERLTAATVTEIAERVLGARADLASLCTALWQRSEGLPLFLDEAIRAPEDAPNTEPLNIAARLERLDDDARAMVEVAAVAGTGFSVELVREVSGWPEADALRALDALVGARFLREPRRKTRNDYVFSHHLVHADVYERVDAAARRRRHAAVARALTELASDTLDDASAEIARHHALAGQNDEAGRAYARAARRAGALFAHEEAVAYAARSVECSAEPEQAAEMHLLRLYTAWPLSSDALAADAIAQLRRLPKSPLQTIMFEMLRAERAHFARDFTEHWEATQNASRAANELGDEYLMACVLDAIAFAETNRGQYAAAQAHHERALDMMPSKDEKAATSLPFMISGQAFTLRRFDKALPPSHDLLLAARREGNTAKEAEALMRMALGLAEIGALGEAERYLCEADEAYAKIAVERGRIWVGEGRARIAARRAQYERAASFYAEPERFARNNRQHLALLRVVNAWALVDLCRGEAEAAARRLDADTALIAQHSDIWACQWRVWRGVASAELGDSARAQENLDRAIADLAELPESDIYAYAVAFATLYAEHFGETSRVRALAAALAASPPESLAKTAFPHLLWWARGDRAHARESYEALVGLMAPDDARTYAQVPWNARFLRGE
jgi:DNA-binding SARP family transcriptional activator/energy-coupling factor transporter ATP-binding protein EcfA2